MGILDGTKVDTITYWTIDSFDNFGDPSGFSREERSVRWEDRNEFFYGADGQGRQSESVFYDDQNSYVNGAYVFRGSSNESDPRDQTGFRKIQAVHETKSLDGNETIWKVML